MATRANFIIDQGTTFNTTINLSQTDGTLFQLDDYTARGKIRKSYSSSTATTFTASISENSPSQDTVSISLNSDQTGSLQAGRYVYDVEVVDSSSSPDTVTRILEGHIEITPSVTQTFSSGEGIGVDSPS